MTRQPPQLRSHAPRSRTSPGPHPGLAPCTLLPALVPSICQPTRITRSHPILITCLPSWSCPAPLPHGCACLRWQPCSVCVTQCPIMGRPVREACEKRVEGETNRAMRVQCFLKAARGSVLSGPSGQEQQRRARARQGRTTATAGGCQETAQGNGAFKGGGTPGAARGCAAAAATLERPPSPQSIQPGNKPGHARRSGPLGVCVCGLRGLRGPPGCPRRQTR